MLPDDLELAARIVLAVALGAAIGWEREVYDHPAGLRTHMSVAVGAALFGAVGAYGFQEFEDVTGYRVDPTRVASGVVQGVGFLGGGAILKYGASVKGLTTAASLWVTAAIGLGVGLGQYTVSVAATAVMLFVLLGLRRPRSWLSERFARVKETALVKVAGAGDHVAVARAIREIDGLTVKHLSVERDGPGAVLELDLDAKAGTDIASLLLPIGDMQGVQSISVG